jgi:hypothetical protein
MPSNTPVQQSAQHIIADQIEDLMVDIARMPNRGRALNIAIGVLAALAEFLRTDNSLGLGTLAKVCDRELSSMRQESSTL